MTRTPDRHNPKTRAETPAGPETGRTPTPRTATPRTATPRTPTTRTPATRNAAIGDYGERVAARFLADAGLVVLARNWRCALGELDLVVRDGPTLVVCEVKTRRIPAVEHPLAAVTPGKAERLRRLAERWIAEHPDLAAPGCDVRIDLVA
ncbi:MAG: YraN family protein, partial [Streptomycetaceae bacterium]|nr:YraN family protein [Streptomycetaceae bacterium]